MSSTHLLFSLILAGCPRNYVPESPEPPPPELPEPPPDPDPEPRPVPDPDPTPRQTSRYR